MDRNLAPDLTSAGSQLIKLLQPTQQFPFGLLQIHNSSLHKRNEWSISI